jgi:hypothetical protein
MRIFELTTKKGKEWIAANTIIEALKTYCSMQDVFISELDDEDELTEIPESEWGEYYSESANAKQYFTEWMKENGEPSIICGSFY